MNANDSIKFLESLQYEEKLKLLDSYVDSIKYTEKYILIITKWLAILVFLYYLLSNKLLEGFEIVGVKFNNYEFVEKYFPFAVSCLILFYIVAGLHKAKCINNYENLFQNIYLDDQNLWKSINYHANLLLPFGVFREIQSTKNDGCFYQFLSWISLFPILIIQLLPYIFMYDSLKNIYQTYWNDPYIKLVFFATIWFVLLGIIKFCLYIIKSVNEDLEVQQ